MLSVNLDQRSHVVVDVMNTFTTLPIAVEVHHDRKVDILVADLSPDISWGDRKIAAEKLGSMRSPKALPGLLNALPTDPFWMVRGAIIQALAMIGDPRAIPTLRDVAKNDGFQAVRSYAAKVIEKLTSEG